MFPAAPENIDREKINKSRKVTGKTYKENENNANEHNISDDKIYIISNCPRTVDSKESNETPTTSNGWFLDTYLSRKSYRTDRPKGRGVFSHLGGLVSKD